MNFYSLVEKSGKVLADVIEFEDGQVVVKWTGSIGSLVIHKSLNEFKQISLNDNRELIKDGVEEDFNDVKDLLYSA